MIWIVLASIALILFSVYLFRPVPAPPAPVEEQKDDHSHVLYYPVNYVNPWNPFAYRYGRGFGGYGRRHGGRRGGGRRGGRR